MASPEPITVSAAILSQMFLYLESLQVDISGFLHSIGIDPQSVQSPDAYLPVETYLHIQESAADYVKDPYFGLHMGEYAQPGSWSIIGYMMMNCSNLGEAFEKSGRYSRIIGNMIEGHPQFRLNKVRLVFSTPPHTPNMSRHCFESAFSSTIRMVRTLTGLQLNPLEVTFIYPHPGSTSEYDRVFRCPVLFDHKENSITMPTKWANLPIRMPNPALLDHFEQYARDFSSRMDRDDETTKTVTRIILSRLDDESLSIKKVAREMSVSVRTLQNHLKAEGMRFSDLLRDIRSQLARKYLHEDYSVEQITYLLGFSEPSVFRKAFKKWTGYTPRQFCESTAPGPHYSYPSAHYTPPWNRPAAG